MEQVFFRAHVRIVGVYGTVFNSTARKCLEVISFVNMSIVCLTFIWLHSRYYTIGNAGAVGAINCISFDDPQFQPSPSDIVKINILSDEYLQYKNYKPDHSDNSLAELFGVYVSGRLENMLYDYDGHDRVNNSNSMRSYLHEHGNDMVMGVSTGKGATGQLSTSLNEFFRQQHVYLFSNHRKILVNPTHGVFITANDIAQSSHECFGPSIVPGIISRNFGYDRMLFHWALSRFANSASSDSSDVLANGVLYSLTSRKMVGFSDMYAFRETSGYVTGPDASIVKQIQFTVKAVVSGFVLYFIARSMVSFILVSTQEKMLKFTYLLQYCVRQRIPHNDLIFSHLYESFVFVPIMLGVHYFLLDFFRDQLLSFLMLSMVWLVEVYNVLCVRTPVSQKTFPVIVAFFFTGLMFYWIHFPFGFPYFALFTICMCLQFTMVVLWHQYELPALANGSINALCPRGVHVEYNYMSDDDSDIDISQSRSHSLPRPPMSPAPHKEQEEEEHDLVDPPARPTDGDVWKDVTSPVKGENSDDDSSATKKVFGISTPSYTAHIDLSRMIQSQEMDSLMSRKVKHLHEQHIGDHSVSTTGLSSYALHGYNSLYKNVEPRSSPGKKARTAGVPPVKNRSNSNTDRTKPGLFPDVPPSGGLLPDKPPVFDFDARDKALASGSSSPKRNKGKSNKGSAMNTRSKKSSGDFGYEKEGFTVFGDLQNDD